jgi:hypothetical protein
VAIARILIIPVRVLLWGAGECRAGWAAARRSRDLFHLPREVDH